MGKYSKDQLALMADGVFKGSSEPVFHASSNGTFFNERQYQKLTKAEQDDCIAFENPKYAKAEKPKAESKKAEGGEPAAEGGAPDAEGTEATAKKGKKK